MKKVLKMATPVVFASALALLSPGLIAGGTHEHKHGHEMMEFDPVDNEFGMYEPDMEVTKTIEIVMSDEMRFTPTTVNVKKGDVILFKHSNQGELMHEFVLGTSDSLDEHAEMMKKFPGMEHSEPYMAHVAPGEDGSVVWKFSKEGEYAFGCLVPGHYDAGMKGTVIVGS